MDFMWSQYFCIRYYVHTQGGPIGVQGHACITRPNIAYVHTQEGPIGVPGRACITRPNIA